ncbi:MAG: 2-dehydropantoate 2-reductase [Chloroflexi bacterium]|nr:2-dehydropantoate 2-reductase [Chloroflexota bacterium]
MKIAVMATGGVGGYLGALFAKNGNEVTFIARGAHLHAIRANGLTVTSISGDVSVRPARATDNPAEVGTVDWILFAVKTYDTASAAQTIRPIMGSNTTVVTFQNGVESCDILAAAVGKEHVLPAPIQIESAITAPGVIAQTSSFRVVTVGELDGRITPRVEWLVAQLQSHGLDVTASDKMPAPIWAKMLFLASFSGLTTLARTEGSILFKQPQAQVALRAAMQEVFDVATAYGVPLAPDLIEQRMKFVLGIQPGMTASMHKDLLKGNRLEIDALSGAIVRLGAAKGVATPVHQTIYMALKQEDARAKLKSNSE